MHQAILRFFWAERPYTGGEYIEAVTDNLSRLNRVSERFTNMLVLGEAREHTHALDSELRNASELVLATLPREWAYHTPTG